MTRAATNPQRRAADRVAHDGPHRHIAGLDGIRAVAAGLVLLFHYWGMSGRPELPAPLSLVATNGGVGVDLFFVISGFILFLPWARAAWTGRPVRRRRYLENRFRRILPAFWFNMAVLVVVAQPAMLFGLDGLRDLFLYGTFLAGFAPPSVAPTLMLNAVAWTLCIEVTFYLALPLIAPLFVRHRWRVALPAVLLAATVVKMGIIARYGDLADPGVMVAAARNLAGTMNEFASGMAVAGLWASLEHRRVRVPLVVGPACTVIGLIGIWAPLYVGQYVVGREDMLHGTGPLGWIPWLTMFPLVALSAAVALFGICHTPNALTRLLSVRPIAYLGVVSYGIYLWHLPVGSWLAAGIPDGNGAVERLLLLLTVSTAVTIGCAAFSHRFVEQPFLRSARTPVVARPDGGAAPGPGRETAIARPHGIRGPSPRTALLTAPLIAVPRAPEQALVPSRTAPPTVG
ncbi:acyltransferase [uncultured Modestobacter sp.]|uniref:acyltransferase family protein n=1 Tax=uncultured Modestobacter sp. TaxID=380048 RepID=UPI0026079564|nr:acyltransferase [uncultured Modestobacter sp.]